MIRARVRPVFPQGQQVLGHAQSAGAIMSRYLFTSESVTEGHPDKVCDNVSDAILDAALAGDKTSRVACETAVKTGFVLLAGEITTKTNIDYAKIVRDTIRDIGYTDSDMGFD